MAMHQQPQSPLFKLPAELRNRIYEQVAVQYKHNDQPGIFRTCRRVRDEGLKLYYATHPFFFVAKEGYTQRWEAPKFHHFLTKLGAERAVKIEHMCFETGDHRARYDAPNAEKVLLDVVLDAEKPEVIHAKFSRDDVSQAELAELEEAKTRLHAQWSIHPNPTKAGSLRTVAALIPSEVKFSEADEEEA